MSLYKTQTQVRQAPQQKTRDTDEIEGSDLNPPLAHCSQGKAGELNLVVRTRESWQADQPCKYPGSEPRL